MPVLGSPDVLTDAADTLERVATAFEGFGRDVGGPVRAMLAGWHGTAAPVALARLDQDIAILVRAVDGCRLVAPALRTYADELRRAQRDAADGETLASPGGAPADAETGGRIVQSAVDGLGFAAEDAARTVREATALLPVPRPVDVEGGNALDGLLRAGGDTVDELALTLRGAVDRVNVLSDRFGPAWADTERLVAAIATDPMSALDAAAASINEPVAESYRTGGVDEAVGRGVGTVAAALLGGKGLTKLGRLVPDAPAPVGPLAALRRAPGGGLRRHEDLGGHALSLEKAHVGASDHAMRERLDREPRRRRVSSYTHRLVAERAVHDNLRGNARAIDAWLTDPAETRPRSFRWEHERVVGRTALRDGAVSDTSLSTVVLKKDLRAPLGYYILSTYPGE